MDPRKPARPVSACIAWLSTVVVAAVGLGACSSTKTAVGGSLLGSVADENTRRDTLLLPLTPSAALARLNYQYKTSYATSEMLLIGQANGLRATTLLKYGPPAAWTEVWTATVDAKAVPDTITITPTSINVDSAAGFIVTFGGFAADSLDDAFLSAWTTPIDWEPTDPVTTPLPPAFLGTQLFADRRLALVPDSGTTLAITSVPVTAATLAQVWDFADTLSLALQGGPTATMVQLVSRDAYLSYSPYFYFNVNAHVTSKVLGASAERDTVIALTVRPTHDVFRLERLPGSVAPTPQPNTLLLTAGVSWHGYAKINRFDIPHLADSAGVLARNVTVNSAVLEVQLASGGQSYLRDQAQLQLYALAEPFDLDSATVGSTLFVNRSYLLTSAFQTNEAASSTADVRRFEIGDMLNRWVQDGAQNDGLVLRLGQEDRRVDVVEVVGLRLILTTTIPPAFGEGRARTTQGGA